MKRTTGSNPRAASRSVPPADRKLSVRSLVFSISWVPAAIGLAGTHANSEASPAGTASACASQGGWIDVKTGGSIARGELFRNLAANASVVLLGEMHTSTDHHYWQLHTLAALYGRGRNVVIGFEAFPRRLQGVLNDWIDGKLTPEAFLKASEWRQVWGYD